MTPAKQYAYFSELPDGAQYLYNGEEFQCATGYGKGLAFTLPAPRHWWEVTTPPPNQLCIVGPYSRLAPDYFD